MLAIVRFIGRRLFKSQSTKFRLISRVVTFIGIVKVATRVVAPVRRVILRRDESMEIRITKNGQNAS